jgi:DNA polymerase-3 subunit alpha
MTSPTFTHLRVHSEYSIVDGLVRIDDLVGAAAKDKQPALAVTDLANMFCMVRFYKAARGKGIKPIVGVDAWITNDDNRDKPFAPAAAGQKPHRLPAAVRPAVARLAHQSIQGPRRDPRRMAGSAGHLRLHAEPDGPGQRPDRAVGRLLRRRRPGHRQRRHRTRRAQCARAGRASSPAISISRSSAPASLEPGAGCAIRWRWPAAWAAGGGDPSGAVHQQGRIHRPRGAHLYRRGRDAGQRQARAPLQRRDVLQDAGRDGGELFHDLPGALANSVEIAKRCNVVLTLGKPQLPTSRRRRA